MELSHKVRKVRVCIADFLRRRLASDWTWDVLGVLGSIAVLYSLYALRVNPGGLSSVFGAAAADASVPLLVVFLCRYWYRYRRPGDTFCRVVDAYNHPDIVPGVSEYLGDQMLTASAEVNAMLAPEGVELGIKKYDVAIYLISWLSRARLQDAFKCYRGVLVGPFDDHWSQWEEKRSLQFGERPITKTLPQAFEDLASAVGRRSGQHRRIVALSASEFISFLSGGGADFLKFVKWHSGLGGPRGSDLPARELDLPIRVLIFRSADDLARRFKEWSGAPDLIDYGVIGRYFVFGNGLNGHEGLSAKTKLLCRTAEVLNYEEQFDGMWQRCDRAFSFDLRHYDDRSDAIKYLKIQESQENWPVSVKGMTERTGFFEQETLHGLALPA